MKVEFSEPVSGRPPGGSGRSRATGAIRSSSPVTSSPLVPEDRAADLAPDHGLLDQDLRVVLARGLDARPPDLRAGHLGDAERRAGTGRLHEDGVVERRRRRRPRPAMHGPERPACAMPARPRRPCRRGDLSMHSAEAWMSQPTYGMPGELQQALTAPSSPQLAVEHGEHDVEPDRLVAAVEHEQPVDARIGRQHGRTAEPVLQPGPGPVAQPPVAGPVMPIQNGSYVSGSRCRRPPAPTSRRRGAPRSTRRRGSRASS